MRGLIKLVILNIAYLHNKLPIKLSAQELMEIPSSCFQKLDGCLFLKYGFKSGCPEKFETNTSEV